MVDLPNIAAMVMGLDDWKLQYATPVGEERLLAAVRGQLGSQVERLMLPPVDLDEGSRDSLNGPRIGVPVAIDDFNVVGAGMPILDHSAVRLLKIDAELTTNALQHRLTQARVVGLVQTAKVMGLQTVAKRVMGGDHSNWLTALGVDFVQSFEASPPVALDSLLQG